MMAPAERGTNETPGGERPRRPARTRVAILGGGMASLTTAYELSRTAELRERYEVTVYQLGWRLGGKGACGRNEACHDRIEEHGLHIWFGFYHNAFRMMRECYAELGRPAGAPLATIEDAFKPLDRIVLYEHGVDGWEAFRLTMPRNSRAPGTVDSLPGFWDMVVLSSRWLRGNLRELFRRHRATTTARRFVDLQSSSPRIRPNVDLDVEGNLRRLVGEVNQKAIDGQREAAGSHSLGATAPNLQVFVETLEDFKSLFRRGVVDKNPLDRMAHRLYTMTDIALAIFRGVLRGELLADDRGFDRLDDQEFSAWLAQNGIDAETLNSSFIQAFYDMAFAFLDGNTARNGRNMAAGTALLDILRLAFTYDGAFAWKMQAGMGDTVFAPLYRVLEKRGVTFKFFHRITQLRLDASRSSVDAIEVAQQAVIDVGGYEPLVDVNGLECWPSTPKWTQLRDGIHSRDTGRDFERDYSTAETTHRVTLARHDDFDEVVLGIPLPALEPICRDLIADRPRFAEMISHGASVMTQAFQLWMTKPVKQLGWAHGNSSIMISYVEPLDTYCDMTHLIPRESWPRGSVGSIAYFCGVLPHSVDGARITTQAQADALAKQYAVHFLEHDAGPVWPRATSADGQLQWDLLVDERNRVGPTRFDAQYWRANFQPWERYVQTPAGSVKYRLRADQSGYDNLYLAGDWTENGLNAGCVEAAVISGVQAARAITGGAFAILGEDRAWPLRRATHGQLASDASRRPRSRGSA